jgi:hypothetical protein
MIEAQRILMNQILDNLEKSSRLMLYMPRMMGKTTFRLRVEEEIKKRRV